MKRTPLSRYNEIEDPFERRRAAIALHIEGWTPASIADYLDLSRSTTYDLLKRFQEEGWERAKLEHERWMAVHNEQSHWAHRQREDGKRTPAEGLDQALGHVWSEAYLHRVFFTRRFSRWLDRLGYLRFRQWHLYGEEGLARQPATIWLSGKTLTIEFASTPLTQFAVTFQPDQKRLRTVKLLDHFKTPYRSPQLSLWSEEEIKWLLAWKAPPSLRHKPTRPVDPSAIQPTLFSDPEAS